MDVGQSRDGFPSLPRIPHAEEALSPRSAGRKSSHKLTAMAQLSGWLCKNPKSTAENSQEALEEKEEVSTFFHQEIELGGYAPQLVYFC